MSKKNWIPALQILCVLILHYNSVYIFFHLKGGGGLLFKRNYWWLGSLFAYSIGLKYFSIWRNSVRKENPFSLNRHPTPPPVWWWRGRGGREMRSSGPEQASLGPLLRQRRYRHVNDRRAPMIYCDNGYDRESVREREHARPPTHGSPPIIWKTNGFIRLHLPGCEACVSN